MGTIVLSLFIMASILSSVTPGAPPSPTSKVPKLENISVTVTNFLMGKRKRLLRSNKNSKTEVIKVLPYFIRLEEAVTLEEVCNLSNYTAECKIGFDETSFNHLRQRLPDLAQFQFPEERSLEKKINDYGSSTNNVLWGYHREISSVTKEGGANSPSTENAGKGDQSPSRRMEIKSPSHGPKRPVSTQPPHTPSRSHPTNRDSVTEEGKPFLPQDPSDKSPIPVEERISGSQNVDNNEEKHAA